jgi:3-hydroxyacyl-[acyl-carrier-protein] dehydratase
MAEMDIQEILTYLPHRFPFLLLDRILESDWDTRIVALKNISVNEPFFQGHFPGQPVMPGVLQLEAMAQAGGLLLNKKHERKAIIAYFTAVDKAKFRRMVIPGDQLRIEVTFLKHRLRTVKVHGEITVDGELSCQADLMFSYME